MVRRAAEQRGRPPLSVAANQMHFVPVLPRGTYTYHARPSVTQLEPPGGPVVGGTLVTLHGSGFDALGAEGTRSASLTTGRRWTLRYLSTGTSIVCRTGKNNRAQRKRLTVSLNTQDYEPVAWLRYYERPTVSAIAPTGGPTRPGYQLQVVGSGLDGMLAAMNTADEYGVTGLFKPLCRFGAMIGAVTKVGSDGESLECDVPTNGSAGAYQTAFALNGLDFDVGVDERFDAPHKYLYFHQRLLLVTPGGGPVGGGTVVRVEGEGFDGFDNLAATAKCRFVRDGAACAATSSARCDDGAAALGKVRVILSGNALECEAPDVGVVSDTHIQVSLNGVHFVGADTEDASWLLYQYYHQPRLLGLDPAGGPTAGSGAAGMSQTSWVVTLHGRGFTRLSNRPEVRCAFGPPEGGAPTAAAVVYSATFVTCLLPPHPPADVLMALTLNGQDYVHQRVEEWYDISNKSETGPEHDDLRQRMEAKEWPLPGNLSRLTTAVPPPPDIANLTSNGSTLIRHYSGTYFHFRYYSQTLDTLVPRRPPRRAPVPPATSRSRCTATASTECATAAPARAAASARRRCPCSICPRRETSRSARRPPSTSAGARRRRLRCPSPSTSNTTCRRRRRRPTSSMLRRWRRSRRAAGPSAAPPSSPCAASGSTRSATAAPPSGASLATW